MGGLQYRYSSCQLSLCVKSRFSFGFEALPQTKPQTLRRWKPSHNSPLCFFKEHGVGLKKKIHFGKTGSGDNDREDEKRQQAVSSGLSSETGGKKKKGWKGNKLQQGQQINQHEKNQQVTRGLWSFWRIGISRKAFWMRNKMLLPVREEGRYLVLEKWNKNAIKTQRWIKIRWERMSPCGLWNCVSAASPDYFFSWNKGIMLWKSGCQLL